MDAVWRAMAWMKAVVEDAVTTVLAFIAVVVLYPLDLTWFESKTPRECDPNDPQQTPILLIHGFLGRSHNWIYHRARLRRAGYTNAFTVNLGSPFRSIEEYAATVAAKVAQIRRRTNRNDVILIGHSMGGLVAQQYRYSLSDDEAVNISKIITIGTPCLGTKVARLAAFISASAKEMVPNSPLLLRQQACVLNDTTTHYVRIAAGTDWVVLPGTSALGVENAKRTIHRIPSRGHLGLLLSAATADVLIDELR
jgi:pimeloyl-ACP methyl ester carboxylesterase